ncbi:hypothetical protein A3I95_03390 [Candidatus Nomurabacteria bacterium RIFCSPLOWO2_02_FULL_44_12]|uniref:Type II secretion system protein GspG C-terminal domain-containing protein n=1 Tax=Candidatus Nomurabacteria bacterium RIFCSPLOWO2_12_FULL_44_11 TaxID=1801796 RepID=A0A1F6Y733_9BACT|nr:MAG: hypothetical protein A3E95_00970 [Candidatus Nomurabacteria bacterium RIFCSPHIGHO2_12_FULL_44_22b]OGJ02184.1 MAG: hypothetical protein A3G53_02220 [Candidatus Nomurabacteria bacterium RIFCSPLOWO2_12_FULL_44_11]OGJ07641.1 MAG: hypothetical protein A3I95_03390 [Candidatus Nomurabacteria bacterium RIFCSPLOWO2_02_FULL_44_12]
MGKAFKTGFTLIELLVVVAIIGLASAVVFAALNSARSRSADVAIKQALNNAQKQAELYASSNDWSYNNVCVQNQVANGVSGIYPMLLNAAQQFSSIPPNVTGLAWSYTLRPAVCHNGDPAWAAMVALKNPGNSGWCVDSTGFFKETTMALGLNETVCQ